MSSLETVKTKARRVIRSRLANVAPATATAAILDRKAEDICAALDLSHGPKGVESYIEGMTLVGINIELLGDKCIRASVESLLSDDKSRVTAALVEDDVDDRKITNDFAASEICDKCGLPKSNDKININRMDVEDEVFGKQFDSVYSDVCSCQLSEMLKLRLGYREGESEEDRTARMKKEEEDRKREAKKNPILALWEEQNDMFEEDAAASAVAAEKKEEGKKSATMLLPERREREQ